MTATLNAEERSEFVRALLRNSGPKHGPNHGLKQHELADLVGVSVRTVARWCSDADPSAPSDSDFAKVQVLAASLGLSPSDASFVSMHDEESGTPTGQVTVAALREMLSRRPLGAAAAIAHEADVNLTRAKALALAPLGLAAMGGLMGGPAGMVGGAVAAGAATALAGALSVVRSNPVGTAEPRPPASTGGAASFPVAALLPTHQASAPQPGAAATVATVDVDAEARELLESLAEDLDVDVARLRRRLLPVLFTLRARGVNLDGLIAILDRLGPKKPSGMS